MKFVVFPLVTTSRHWCHAVVLQGRRPKSERLGNATEQEEEERSKRKRRRTPADVRSASPSSRKSSGRLIPKTGTILPLNSPSRIYKRNKQRKTKTKITKQNVQRSYFYKNGRFSFLFKITKQNKNKNNRILFNAPPPEAHKPPKRQTMIQALQLVA